MLIVCVFIMHTGTCIRYMFVMHVFLKHDIYLPSTNLRGYDVHSVLQYQAQYTPVHIKHVNSHNPRRHNHANI